jgi:integrase
MDDGTPPNTRRAYASDMKYFWSWASAIRWTEEPIWPVPVEIVARFIAEHLEGLDSDVDQDLVDRGVKLHLGTHSITTVDRRISALSSIHRMRKLPNPCSDPLIIMLMSKSRKASARRGYKPRKKKAVIKDVLDQLLATCDSERLIDVRDRALLLFGWASGGRRRSEIATAMMGDLEEVDAKFVYHLGITKTTQDGDGIPVPVSGKAATALRTWLQLANITKGPIFRPLDRHENIMPTSMNDRTVARIIKRRAKLAGLDPSQFAGHSLRSGFLTEAGLRNINLQIAMQMSAHKTVQVAAGYHQAGNVLFNEAANMMDDDGTSGLAE